MLFNSVILVLVVGLLGHIEATGIEKATKACASYPTISSLRQLKDLIISGEHAADNEFPFMAFLGYPVEHEGKIFYEGKCSGALVSDKYVITASHCIPDEKKPELARFGSNWANATKDDIGVQLTKIKKTFKHPDYTPKSHLNDIALLELETPVKFTKSVSPICLYTKIDDDGGLKVMTEGWGRTDPESFDSLSLNLQKVQLQTVKTSECSAAFAKVVSKKFEGIFPSMLCVTGATTKTGIRGDTCAGDGGSAVQLISEDKYHLIGVNSFGRKCGAIDTPSVATRVASHIDWVASVIWP